jgi:multiple sugar transport system permease protein
MAVATETPITPPTTPRRRRFTKTEMRNLRTGLLFISPWIFGFIAFKAYPIYYTLRLSFTRYSGFGEPQWIGLANFQRMLTDDLFWKSLYNTLYYTLLAVPIGVVVALVLALAMNRPLREVGVYRSSLVLPSYLPLVASTFIFIALLDPVRGIFNQFLGIFGIDPINWFGDPAYAKLGLVMVAQLGAGAIAIIFLAGLKGIPLTLYEAAEIDGAGTWSRFWNITWPMMTPVILYDIILGLSLGMENFVTAYIVGNGVGNPANSTLMYVVYLYLNAFRYSQMGYAAAMSVVLFIISFLIALAIFRWARGWVQYDTV